MVATSFVLLVCIQSVFSDEDVRDFGVSQLLGLFQNLSEYRPGDVSSQDVTFYLFTKNLSNLPIPLEGNNPMDLTKKTKIIIHGWIDNHNRSWFHYLTDAYLSHGDYNIIQVDWGRVSQSFYLSSAHNTRLVGKYVAMFIINHKLPPKNVHLIGHSLGAHIAGSAAEVVANKLHKKVKRVTGLDPAGPGFSPIIFGLEKGLKRENAEVVDVYHTDGGFLGMYMPMGSFDIYINGGVRIQPDCVLNLTLSHTPSAGELFEDAYCSHTRSYVRFTEIVNGTKYRCKKCDSWLLYVTGLCDSADFYVFGAEDIDKTYTGVCFVDTAKDSE